MKKHLDVKIFGLVQGIFFRATAKEQAEKLDITGFAQNKPDGSVYIEAEGEEENLNQFINWCHQGPFLAKVDKVEVSENLLRNFKEFEIY